MLIIGLTGGIASGKTTVSDLFAAQGVPVVDADVAARRVVEPGQPGLSDLVAHFGGDILTEDGTLDRQALRHIAFSSEDARKQLEAILHPRIREHMDHELATCKGDYALLSVPLLVESNLLDMVSRVLVVDVPEEIQRQRLTERDGSTPDQADAILAAQSSRDVRLLHADDIIDNSGDPAVLRDQVTRLHGRYLELARSAGDGGNGAAEG